MTLAHVLTDDERRVLVAALERQRGAVTDSLLDRVRVSDVVVIPSGYVPVIAGSGPEVDSIDCDQCHRPTSEWVVFATTGALLCYPCTAARLDDQRP